MQARVWSRLLIILACICLCGAAPAGQDLEGIAAGIARDMPARLEEFANLAKDLASREKSRVKKQTSEIATPSPGPSGSKILLFVTLGEKPAENLEANRRLFKDIRQISPEAVVVLRGLPQGARTLGDLFKYMRQLIGKKGPQVILNPPLFQKYDVTVSPTLVYERDGIEVARCRGIINASWLHDQVERDKATGDLGKWGETVPIAERDLVEEMRSRLAGIDWQAKKDLAVARYWDKQHFIELPKARLERVIYLDATYKVEKDFILPDGRVVARAGQKIDLFKIMPPTFMLVVFDASDPRQLAWAVKTGKEYAGQHSVRVKYITTTMPDREHGWESLKRLYAALDAQVYLLTPPVRDRFKLEHVPSLVRFDKTKHKFEVKEIAGLPPAAATGARVVQPVNSTSPNADK